MELTYNTKGKLWQHKTTEITADLKMSLLPNNPIDRFLVLNVVNMWVQV